MKVIFSLLCFFPILVLSDEVVSCTFVYYARGRRFEPYTVQTTKFKLEYLTTIMTQHMGDHVVLRKSCLVVSSS
jgi:hypothetical protein